MLVKEKVCSYYLVRKLVFQSCIIVVSVVNSLLVILFST